MKLSVIIPCYNAEATLAEQLEALAQQAWSHPWEVVVANNRSTDGSIEIVQRYQQRMPNLRIVDASLRQGQPFALNTGVEQALGESVAFADADDVVGEGWVAALGTALLTNEFVAARIDDERLNSGWIRRSRGNNQRDRLQPYRYPQFLPHAGGGTIGIRRALFLEIGGFDEALPYLHDTDFCWRAQLRGVTLVFVPEAVMHVRYRESLQAMFKQARNYSQYNVLLYKMYRAHGMPQLSWKTGVRNWGNVFRRLLQVRDKSSLGIWLWYFGSRYGRVQGSIKHRILAL